MRRREASPRPAPCPFGGPARVARFGDEKRKKGGGGRDAARPGSAGWASVASGTKCLYYFIFAAWGARIARRVHPLPFPLALPCGPATITDDDDSPRKNGNFPKFFGGGKKIRCWGHRDSGNRHMRAARTVRARAGWGRGRRQRGQAGSPGSAKNT